MAVKSEILGVRELQDVLRQLPDDLQRNALNSAGRAGAQEIQRAAYAQLALAMASRSPRAEDVVIQKRRSRDERVQVTYDIGPPRGRPQLRWLHDGVAAHVIQARSGGVLASRRGAGRAAQFVIAGFSARAAGRAAMRIFGTTVSHPGQKPTMWLTRAQHGSVSSAFSAAAESLRQSIPRQIKKLASTKYTATLRGRIARHLK